MFGFVLLYGKRSLPSWERGLKSDADMQKGLETAVAPFVGAWIEIFLLGMAVPVNRVAPFVGAWIEIE